MARPSSRGDDSSRDTTARAAARASPKLRTFDPPRDGDVRAYRSRGRRGLQLADPRPQARLGQSPQRGGVRVAVLHGGAGTRAVAAGLLLLRALREGLGGASQLTDHRGRLVEHHRCHADSVRARPVESGHIAPTCPIWWPRAGESAAERPDQPQGRGPLSVSGARLQGMTALDRFSAPTREWFEASFASPTPAQEGAWDAIAAGKNALVVAPTGSGKTLSAFLHAIDRLLSTERPDDKT